MNDFEKDVIDRLARIENSLKNDMKALYGNGKPGLVDKVGELEKRLSILESKSNWIGDTIAAVAWLATTLIAGYAAFFKHG